MQSRENPTTRFQVILDCDPGIDDALALFLAAGSSDQLDLLGVTCVAGNRPVEVTTDNACRLLKATDREDIAVYAGADRPLAYPVARCNLVHGEDGLGGVRFPAAGPAAQDHAVDFIVRTLQRAPEHSVTLVAIGPLTNLASAEIMYPGLLKRARSMVIMGGAVTCPGNVTPKAEFNFYADPVAAQIVLDSGGKIELFGLDVTSKAVMSNAWIASLADLPGVCGQGAHQMLQAYAALDPLLHDTCPVAYLVQPELFSGSCWHLSVDCTTGANAGHVTGSRMDDQRQTNALVFDRVHCEGLMALVRERITKLP